LDQVNDLGKKVGGLANNSTGILNEDIRSQKTGNTKYAITTIVIIAIHIFFPYRLY
jgi:hypothetical protein